MFDKAGVSYKRYVREFKLEGEYSVKDEIKVDVFEAGDKIDATAIAKGKGFQGAIKRHGQSRGPMAHGSLESLYLCTALRIVTTSFFVGRGTGPLTSDPEFFAVSTIFLAD